MTNGGNGLFADIARIEKQADEILGAARTRADDIRKKTEADVVELAEQTDRKIEQARAKLAEDYQVKTDRALTHIDVEFLKDEESLETTRENRLDELVGWTASQILDRVVRPSTDGD